MSSNSRGVIFSTCLRGRSYLCPGKGSIEIEFHSQPPTFLLTVCMETLRWLSFNKENQADMMANTALIDCVVNVFKDTSHHCHAAAEAILFQLRGRLCEHTNQDYRSVGERACTISPSLSLSVSVSPCLSVCLPLSLCPSLSLCLCLSPAVGSCGRRN